MTIPVFIELPDGAAVEIGDSNWPVVASANWNRPNDDGYVEWTETICRHADGRLLVYVLMLPPSGIINTSGMIMPSEVGLVDVVEALAKKFDVPSHVPYSCIQRYKRATSKSKV